MKRLWLASVLMFAACSVDDEGRDDETTDLTTGWSEPDVDGDDTGRTDTDADGGTETGL